jgi:hypothetical protein
VARTTLKAHPGNATAARSEERSMILQNEKSNRNEGQVSVWCVNRMMDRSIARNGLRVDYKERTLIKSININILKVMHIIKRVSWKGYYCVNGIKAT